MARLIVVYEIDSEDRDEAARLLDLLAAYAPGGRPLAPGLVPLRDALAAAQDATDVVRADGTVDLTRAEAVFDATGTSRDRTRSR